MAKVQNTDTENVEITPELFEQSFYQYLDSCKDDSIPPSLPHFLTFVNRTYHTRYTEKDIAETLNYGNENTNKKWKAVLKIVLLGFRGEYFSNLNWTGNMSTKAMLALGKDYGDGVTYNAKSNEKQGIESLQVLFGDGDTRGTAASK